MKKNRLIAVRSTDTALFLQLAEGCECLELIAPVLKVTKPNGTPDKHTWVTDACTGRKLYRVTCSRQPSVVLTAAVQSGQCNGFVSFPLTPEFHALGAGRLDAQLSSVTAQMNVQLQVFATTPSIQRGYAILPRSPQLPLPPANPNAPGAFYHVSFTVLDAGEQEIPLLRIRAVNGLFQVFINGVLYSTPGDYAVLGSTLTLSEVVGVQPGDNVLVIFQ